MPILKKITEQLEAMLSHHSKVHVLRFDLHQPIQTSTNAQLTKFNARLFKWLKRHYKINRIGYTWVREQERQKCQHYHYVLMIDGHKVNYSQDIAAKAAEVWQGIFDGNTVWHPKRQYYNVKRDDYESIQSCVYRISYLAKRRGKGYKPAQTKNYGTSRIKYSEIVSGTTISIPLNHKVLAGLDKFKI